MPALRRYRGDGMSVLDLLRQRHDATEVVYETVEYRCRACGYRGLARAFAAGSASAETVLFIGEARAQEEARTAAASVAHGHAQRRTRLARCPACSKRDRATLWFFIAIHALLGAIAALPAGLVGMLIAGLVGSQVSEAPTPWAYWLAGGVVAALTIALVAWQQTAALLGRVDLDIELPGRPATVTSDRDSASPASRAPR